MTAKIHVTAKIECDDLTLGHNVTIGPGARIRCKKLTIGDCTEIGENFRVDCGEVSIGDYGIVYENCLLYGKAPLSIGHNFFLGGHSILNAYAPLTIGKGVGIGAYSQVWTHASWGEEIEGCLLNKIEPTTILDHAWLIGHVIVGGGVEIGEKSVVLSGAMVTKNVPNNGVVGGVPAKNVPITGYTPPTWDEKVRKFNDICFSFAEKIGCEMRPEVVTRVVRGDESLSFHTSRPKFLEPNSSHFFLDTKTYTKILSPLEVEFMLFCRGGKARFFPE